MFPGPGSTSVLAACLISLAVGQIGLVLAARPALESFTSRPAPAAALRWVGPRFKSVYLWHMPAQVVIAGVTVLLLGYRTPQPGTLLWLIATPLWLATCGFVLSHLLRVFARFETARPAAVASASTVQLVAAGLLASVGLLGLAGRGFTTPVDGGPLSGPVPWIALVVTAFLLAGRRVRLPVLSRQA